MPCLHVRLRPSISLLEAAKLVGNIFAVPLEEHPSDAYDEYPAYAYPIDAESASIRLLGVPLDIDRLADTWPEEFGDADRNFTLTFCAHAGFPVRVDGFDFPQLDATTFAKDVLAKLVQVGFQIYDPTPPYLTDDGGKIILGCRYPFSPIA